ncbi:MAG: response regulator [Deltaproteobacteria bacterium]|nr:response regulator [Deltaproteobacteria bacterium]
MLETNMRVLVVDDLRVMRKIVIHLLEEIGVKYIDTAENGEEALELLRKETYHLVLSDWKMPVLDGIGLLKALRADEKLKHILFIIVTSEGAEAHVKTAIEAGVDGYIVKPLSANTLEQKLLDASESRQIDIASDQPADDGE